MRAFSSVSSTAMPTNLTPWPLSLDQALSNSGASILQGPHQLAKKLTTTREPFMSSRLKSLPSKVFILNGGAFTGSAGAGETAGADLSDWAGPASFLSSLPQPAKRKKRAVTSKDVVKRARRPVACDIFMFPGFLRYFNRSPGYLQEKGKKKGRPRGLSQKPFLKTLS